MAAAASSSSSSDVDPRRKGGWTYDVFLSFRGEDTRNNFVDHLFAALTLKGIHTFKDDKMLRGGQPISQELLKAIKESRWAVVVFSKHYANSSWCLEELSNIMECHKQMGGQKVFPVFYHVDPSDVRKQNGDFKIAFETHEDKFKGGEVDKVKKWREALTAAAGLSGRHILPNYGGEASIINEIVQQISSDIQPRGGSSDNHLIGIQPRIDALISLLKMEATEEVRIVGIWGMGGIVKTRDMRSKKRKLESAATDMKRRKEHNDVKNLMVPDRVPSWLEEAQVIIDNEGDSISAGVIERIDRLMEEKSNMEWTNEQIPLGMVSSATPQVPQDVTQNIFGSRKEIFQRALQLLEADDTTQMVALCGMGGIGKTTMMKELKKVVENRKLFDWVVSVVIGNSTDPIAFQDAIAQYTGEKLSESTREARADRLEKRFLGMSQDGKKKILIILDDLWNIVDLKDIGLASPLPKGFKLFLTTRYERLCDQMGVETSSILRMVGLEEAEAKHCLTNLESLTVWSCGVLGSLIHGENNGAEVIKFHKLKSLELKKLPKFEGLCDNINIVMELPELVKLELAGLPNITCIFDLSNNISATTIPLLNKEVVSPKLKKLEIGWMEKLKEIWACEEEYDRTPVLKEIKVNKCDEIQNLFPNNPMRLLSHLEKLTVYHCGSIQALFDIDSECVGQVKSSLSSIELLGLGELREVWRIRGEDNSGLLIRDFQALKSIKIQKCENLKNIVTPTTIKFDMGALTTVIESSGDKWARDNRSVEFIQDVEFSVPWSLGQYSREINITRCHALSTAIPSYAAEQLQKIEVLKIDYCDSMVEIFETKELENSPLTAIPRLKSITTHKLPNLKKLDIVRCHRLVDIFTFSIFGSLGLLEKLSIQSCEELKVIVRKEHGDQTTTTSKAVIFPCLKSIILRDLPNLKGFFFGMNEFQLPLLDEVIINRCPQMMVFTPLPLITPKLKYIDINCGKYCTPECCSFFTTTTNLPQTPSQSSDNTNPSTTISKEFISYSHYMIEMNLSFDEKRQVIFSYDELLQLQNLEKLNARYCKSALEVFDVGTGVRCSNSSQTVVKLPKLSDVDLYDLKSLKYIWKSNGRTILEFPNLTELSINDCPQLEHVFTSSVVGSLLQLKKLSIDSCRHIEVIVKEDQKEEEGGGGGGDGKVNEIRLPCLKYLSLINLKRLKGFCLGNVDYSLPSLYIMQIEECKSLTIFTKGRSCVPKLKVIETRFGNINLEEEQDINSFIIAKRQEGLFDFDEDDGYDDSEEEDDGYDDGDVDGEGDDSDEDDEEDDAKEEEDDGIDDGDDQGDDGYDDDDDDDNEDDVGI